MSTVDNNQFYSRNEIYRLIAFLVMGILLFWFVSYFIGLWNDPTNRLVSNIRESGYILYFLLIPLSVLITVASYFFIEVSIFIKDIILFLIFKPEEEN